MKLEYDFWKDVTYSLHYLFGKMQYILFIWNYNNTHWTAKEP